MSLLVTFKCLYCGKEIRVPEHYGVQKYCSHKCKHADKMVDETTLLRLARMNMTRKAAAEAIGCSYPTIIRAIKRFNANHLFPPNGAASWWNN